MSSYDKESSEKNKRIIDVLINQILKNLINLGVNSLEIAKKVIKQYPEIAEEDEIRTAGREAEERRRYVNEHAGDASESYRREIEAEAIQKINKRRIVSSFVESESYMRMSHNLFVKFDSGRENGYHWSKFYETEESEPIKEKAMREGISDEIRDKYRHMMVCKLITYTYKYWSIIKEKNISFLAEHFSAMFPNSEFTDKLEIIYGNNQNKKNYVADSDLDIIWTFIHGVIKLCIKYMYYTKRQFFNIKNEGRIVDSVEVDYESDIITWDVNLAVRTDNLEMWNNM